MSAESRFPILQGGEVPNSRRLERLLHAVVSGQGFVTSRLLGGHFKLLAVAHRKMLSSKASVESEHNTDLIRAYQDFARI